MQKRRVAILVSGRGSNMAALIEAARAKDYPAQIVLVASNLAGAPGLAIAAANGIETIIVESKAFGKDREAFERAMHGELQARDIELVCLAGFLRLLTPWFVQQWDKRMLNIHPSLLPSYRGLHTHERALADGVKIHGATVHFVVPEVDSGPIVMQGAVKVRNGDTADTLADRVLRRIEHRIYPAALRLVAAGHVHAGSGAITVRTDADDVFISPAIDELP